MIRKYEPDTKYRNYLLNEGYKETKAWKEGKKKRIRYWLMGFAPLIIFSCTMLIALVMMQEQQPPEWMGILSGVSVLVWIVVGPVAITNLKAQYFSAICVSVNQIHDNVILTDDEMVYSYFDTLNGYTCEYEILYKDIVELKHYQQEHEFLIVGGFAIRHFRGNNADYIKYFVREKDVSVVIPVYYEDNEEMMRQIEERSGVEIEIVA